MRLYYEETDITPFVDITKCNHRDVSGGRCDSLDIELDHAATWHRWSPKMDDRLHVERDGFDTGEMYLTGILPENGRYRMVATSLKSSARNKAWQSYHDVTLEDVVRACAAECGMDYRLYGLDGRLHYTYLERQNEGCAAFLDRLMQLEGAVLKVVEGRFCCISIPWAQEQPVAQTVGLTAEQGGVQYINQEGTRLAGLTIRTPWGEAMAQDTAVKGYSHPVLTVLPARDVVQAGRWARGKLLHHNRQAERLRMKTRLNTGMTAVARVDIESTAQQHGEWLVDEVEHDLIKGKTSAVLLRCINTIR